MQLNPSLVRTEPPPLVGLMARARELQDAGADVINLGQAVIDLPPPRSFVEAVREALDQPATHGYAPDPGLPELREALAGYLAERFGVTWDPHTELMVTAGANLACFAALAALAGPGDEVLLPGPWYFNHAMTLDLLGAVPRGVPGRPEKRLTPEPDALDRACTAKTRGLILVNPNNPTGARYRDGLVRDLAELARRRDLWLLSDQTYQEIHYGLDNPVSPAADPALRDRVATAGSFSKVFGLAGWRLGFLTGPAALITEVLKVQDCSVICAPRAAQVGLLAALPHAAEHVTLLRTVLSARRDALLAALRAHGLDDVTEPGGACFLFLRLPTGLDDARFCAELLEAERVVAVPGRAFGPGGAGHVRISYGTVETERLVAAIERLAQHLERSTP